MQEKNSTKTVSSPLEGSIDARLDKKILNNSFLKINRDTPSYNRLVTTSNVKQGTLLLEADIISAGLIREYQNKACTSCFTKFDKLSRCSICKLVFYCSRDCQKSHWSDIHKYECPVLKQITEQEKIKQMPAQFLILLRIVLKTGILPSLRPETDQTMLLKEQVFQMCNTTEGSTDIQKTHAEMSVRMIFKYDKNPASNYQQKYKDILKIYQIIQVNTFGVPSTNQTSKNMGPCLTPVFNYINHNCIPNCSSSIEGRTMRLVASKDLSKGEEVTISYVDPLQGYSDRQEGLQKGYYFTCGCERCKKEYHTKVDMVQVKKAPSGGDNDNSSSTSVVSNEKWREDIRKEITGISTKFEEFSFGWLVYTQTKEEEFYKSEDFEGILQLRQFIETKYLVWYQGIEVNPVFGWHLATIAKLYDTNKMCQKAIIYSERALKILQIFYKKISILKELTCIANNNRLYYEDYLKPEAQQPQNYCSDEQLINQANKITNQNVKRQQKRRGQRESQEEGRQEEGKVQEGRQ